MSAPQISDAAAISAALAQDWNEAIRINLALLKIDKTNISLLNRLGFAYLQSGQLTLAKKTFLKVTKIDTYNQIAAKNLKKLSSVRQKDLIHPRKSMVAPMSFLEEAGKTKIIECVNVAPIQALSAMAPGDEVEMKAKNHTIEVRSLANNYLGALPDDIAFRLLKFLSAGNTYQMLVKSVDKNSLTVFIRELHRAKKFANQPSFTATAIYVPFTRSERADDTASDESEAKEADQEE